MEKFKISAEGSIAAMVSIMSGGTCRGAVATGDDDELLVLLGAGTSLLAPASGDERLVGRWRKNLRLLRRFEGGLAFTSVIEDEESMRERKKVRPG